MRRWVVEIQRPGKGWVRDDGFAPSLDPKVATKRRDELRAAKVVARARKVAV